jgi:multidrug efflux pump subunit AcrB
MGNVVADVDKLLPELIPDGYQAKWMGMVRDMRDSNAAFGLAFAVAALFIYIVLASQFESFIHPVTIMLSLPLAMIGAFLGLYLNGSAISLGSQIGIILLMGLVTKNAILLVDSAIQFQREGLSPQAAMLRAGPRRLRPILMTTAAMVLGMLPTAMGKGLGSEFRSPMAIAVIGGVISSTFLTLLVVPVVYLGIESFRQSSRRLMAKMFRVEARPDPVLAPRASQAPKRAASDRPAPAE